MAKVSYSKEFFDEMVETNLASARAVVPITMEMIRPRSIVDIGCGEGIWLKAFQESGVEDIRGADGPWVEMNRLLFPASQFTVADLEKQVSFERNFDLAVCLEVAEHVPASSADALVKTLVSAAPVVLFSAAIPLQGGSHHINEQWPVYWAQRFASHGYVPVDAIRRRVWDNENVSFFYKQNILIFVKESSLSSYPKLEEEIKAGHGHALSLVHPHMYLYYAERWRMVVPILGKLPPSFLHSMKKFLSSLRR